MDRLSDCRPPQAILICQHLTVRYAPHLRQALAQAAKEIGSTVEQIMASYLAQQIARRFDRTPKAGGSPAGSSPLPVVQE